MIVKKSVDQENMWQVGQCTDCLLNSIILSYSDETMPQAVHYTYCVLDPMILTNGEEKRFSIFDFITLIKSYENILKPEHYA